MDGLSRSLGGVSLNDDPAADDLLRDIATMNAVSGFETGMLSFGPCLLLRATDLKDRTARTGLPRREQISSACLCDAATQNVVD